MSTPLHTSNKLRRSASPPPHGSTASSAQHDVSTVTNQGSRRASHLTSTVADTEGLRCEVRSMRSVPHALYSLPSVSHVVVAYVRQLMTDFTTSLLLCRPLKKRLHEAFSPKGTEEGEASGDADDAEPTDVMSGADAPTVSDQDEETDLLLRLCALEAWQRRRRRHMQAHHPPRRMEGESGSEEEGGTPDRQWNSTESSAAGGVSSAKGKAGDPTSNRTSTTAVEDQLLELFAAAERARRGPACSDSNNNNNNNVCEAHLSSAVCRRSVNAFVCQTDAPLLSSLLRFKPLLRDMQLLSRHLLLPRHAWPHHQREWVSVYEDTSVTLCDRLARYRVVPTTTCTAPAVGTTSDRDAEVADAPNATDEHDGESSAAQQRRIGRRIPASEIEELWHTLWELLGAAWRQRDRLWGAYRYLQGPRQLPPLPLNSHAAQALPPSVNSSPLLRDQYTRCLVQAASASRHPHPPSAQSRAASLPASVLSAHDEDSCAFGPFTSSDIGISTDRQFVLRQPLAAALRLLRVCVAANGRDALVTSTTAFAGFKYVKEPAARRSTPPTAAAPPPPPPRVVVPLFDATEEDLRLRSSVPYLSPEVYIAQQLLSRSNTRGVEVAGATAVEGHAPVHRFSDDVWNAAVVVLEAALSGFGVFDPTQCHLSRAAAPSPSGRGGEGASPDAMPARPTAGASPQPPTGSVYTDVLFLLIERHRLPPAAAQNFLYASLHHLSAHLKAFEASEHAAEGGRGAAAKVQLQDGPDSPPRAPSPQRLACEWAAYLYTAYEQAFVRDVLAGEVASKGLCWRRSGRWNAFGAAHITSAVEVTSSAPLAVAREGSVSGATANATTSPLAPLHSPLSSGGGDPGNVNERGSMAASHTAGAVGHGRSANHNSSAQQQQQVRASYAAGPTGSGLMLSDSGNSYSVPEASDHPTGGEDDEGGADTAASAARNSAGFPRASSASVTLLRQPPPSLAVVLPSSTSSLVSLDALIQNPSATPPPLHASSTSPLLSTTSLRTVAAAARSPQKLDHAVNALDTPLMPLFGLSGSLRAPSAKAAADSLAHHPQQQQRQRQRVLNDFHETSDTTWDKLSRFLCHRTAGSRNGSVNAGSSGGGGGGSGKANGAVADAADVDCVEELLHLLYACVLSTLRQAESRGYHGTAGNAGSEKKTDAEDRSRYAAVNHPFLRGVAERGLLSTYMTVCGCPAGADSRNNSAQAQRQEWRALGDAGASRAPVLPSLNLYVPMRMLRTTIAALAERGAVISGGRVDHSEVKDRVAAASSIVDSLEQNIKEAGALRTLIGDEIRAREAACDAPRRSRAPYASYLPVYALQPFQQPPPVHRARPAVDAVLNSLELSVSAQLHHTAQLRRLIYGHHTSGAASGGVGDAAATEIRRYLRLNFILAEGESNGAANASRVRSPLFPIPPTIRGIVWGSLLQVPSARKREAVLAHAVHHTAAKPSLSDRQLAVDIPRCHAYHPLLASSRGSAQLQRLLKAWLFSHPRYAYWQGLDSVCAVLLTVSPHDEALVLAQLSAVVERFIAHDEGSEDGLGSRSSLLMSSAPPPLQQQLQLPPKPSMADQLHQLSVVLRYCDPLLAHHLFSVLGCTPELYAISWLLTLFSHSLPTRKVYHLWDLLFVNGDLSGGGSTCLVVLCVAVMMHRRATLLSSDFSGCLTAFSSGAFRLDVAAAVGDARHLMSVLPPSVLVQPTTEEAGRLCASDALHSGGRSPGPMNGAGSGSRGGSSSATDASSLASISVKDVKSAWAVASRRPSPLSGQSAAWLKIEGQQQQQHWSDSGMYFIDVRPKNASAGPHDSLLGAVHLPLSPADSPAPLLDHNAPLSPSASQPTHEAPDLARAGGSRLDQLSRCDAAAGEGWGTVEEQEWLQAQQQSKREAQERHIVDAAAALTRYLSNPAFAAIPPRTGVTAAVATRVAGTGGLAAAPWPVHAMVLKTSMAPHVVIITSGNGSGRAAPAAEGEDDVLAHQLGLQLNACGVHNVSVLRGGMAAIHSSMPELVVPRTQGL
ncbi:hypothetical protein ABL78_4796 [Leptomonas seymouri]|uniref:Uncharacterized protein n=1 Tax=Leptomonas seymouri TaxID=5684 RepID=A0A0N1PCU0_LEPSE|nr:hypothetical protein ABL78_4796 [Leptomonas seymouri]|eukprot:KPI86141.1 hypothetical protein ABL78_4796 [Leptomonas seymouri]